MKKIKKNEKMKKKKRKKKKEERKGLLGHSNSTIKRTVKQFNITKVKVCKRVVVCGHCLVTLSLTINEVLK